MTRIARVVAPGFAHHVTQRGNRGMDIFIDDEDRLFYLRTLSTYAARHGLAIWAYCLMTNHVHFIVVPTATTSLSRVFHDLHSIYTLRFNQRTGESGHLFQGRFYSTVLDEQHLWAAVRYVERNPVRVGLVTHAKDYRWSSAPARCCDARDLLLAPGFPPPGVVDDWQEWLQDEDDAHIDSLRKTTRTGRPCGSIIFMKQLEQLLDIPIAPKKRGRPTIKITYGK